MPPSCAMVMARRASVTVSMAADSTGRPMRMLRLSWVDRSTSRGSTSERAGTSSTSSKVSASSRIRIAWRPKKKRAIVRTGGRRVNQNRRRRPGGLESAYVRARVERQDGISTAWRASTARRACCWSRDWAWSGCRPKCRTSPARDPATGISRSRIATRSCAAPCSASATCWRASRRATASWCWPAGRVSLYEPRGDYQLLVEHLEDAGVGALQRAFEELRARLNAEGLFAAERKRALPAAPRARRRHHLAHRGGDPRHPARAGAALSGRGGADLPGTGPGRGRGAGHRRRARSGLGARRMRRADPGARRRLARGPVGLQ